MTTVIFKKALRSELANAGLTKNKLHDVTDRGGSHCFNLYRTYRHSVTNVAK